MENRVEKAVALHKEGYNCAQAVFVAFADYFDIDKELASRLSSPFGGGVGGMREMCGAIAGVTMLVGLHNGTIKPKDKDGSKANFEKVQLLTNEFKEENGSIICRQLIGLEPGLAEGKQKKPCVEYVRHCASLIEKYIAKESDPV